MTWPAVSKSCWAFRPWPHVLMFRGHCLRTDLDLDRLSSGSPGLDTALRAVCPQVSVVASKEPADLVAFVSLREGLKTGGESRGNDRESWVRTKEFVAWGNDWGGPFALGDNKQGIERSFDLWTSMMGRCLGRDGRDAAWTLPGW